MALLKAPDCGVAVTVTFPDPPEVIVREEGLVVKVKVVPPIGDGEGGGGAGDGGGGAGVGGGGATQVEINETGAEI